MPGIIGAGTNIVVQTLVLILACYGFIVALGGSGTGCREADGATNPLSASSSSPITMRAALRG